MTLPDEHSDGMIDLNKVDNGPQSAPPVPVAPETPISPPSIDPFSPDAHPHHHIGVKEYHGPDPDTEHEIVNRDLTGTGSFTDSGTPPLHHAKISTLTEAEEEYESLNESGPTVYREMSWTRHWLTQTIVLGLAIAVIIFFPRHSLPSWIMWMILAIVSSYWVYPYGRNRYRYNMEWQADADPTGCFPYTRWWWW